MTLFLQERNLSLQPGLARLRSETAAAFSEAQELKARWGDLDKQQAALYQVCPGLLCVEGEHAI
jgi:ESCRT-I complex subunit VPS37